MVLLSSWFSPKPITEWGSWITISGKTPPSWEIDPLTITQRKSIDGDIVYPTGEPFKDIKFWSKTSAIRFAANSPAYSIIASYTLSTNVSTNTNSSDIEALGYARGVSDCIAALQKLVK